MNATKTINADRRSRIEQAIADAEAQTSAEIVCAVASESGRYDRAEAIVGLLGAVIGLGLLDVIHPAVTTGPGEWSSGAIALGWQAAAVVLGFVTGNLLASYCHGLRRLFVGEKHVDAEVNQAAWRVFATAAVRGTVERSGVLIYVSLFERRVVVLADKTALNALGDVSLTELRDAAVAQLKQRRFTEALIATIQAAGAKLAHTLPADRESNPNELTDHVLVFHPRPGV